MSRLSLVLTLVTAVVACGRRASPTAPAPAALPTPTAAPAPGASSLPAPDEGAAGLAPVARTVDVVDRVFGLETPDPYRWMETEAPERDAWMRAHAERTEQWLAATTDREALRTRLRELDRSATVRGAVKLAGGKTFYLETAAGGQLAVLRVRDRRGDRVLFDPATVGGDGHTSIDGYQPSPDGRLVALNLGQAGGEITTIRVLEVATGATRPDRIERVWSEFPVTWLPDSRGFFYTQMAPPRDGVDPLLETQARLHRLGRPAGEDVPVLGRGVGALEVAPEKFPVIETYPGSPWVVATIGGAHKQIGVAVARLADVDRTGRGTTPWTVVATLSDEVVGVDLHGDRLYLLTEAAAPNGQVVSVQLADPALARARVEVPESRERTLLTMSAARDALYVRALAGAGQGRVLRMPWRGRPSEVPLGDPVWIPWLTADPRGDGAVIGQVTWTRPLAYHAYQPRTGRFAPIGLAVEAPAETTAAFGDIEVTVTEVASHDGVLVPLSIVAPRGLARDRRRPTIVTGYGGYGFAVNPSFVATRLAWLERGGVMAFCHVRGGGEKGRTWHEDGARAKKLNGVRDLIACAEYLIAGGYTSPATLFAEGTSAGGLLIGRAITLRPDLFAAVVISVGMVNALRILAAANGANQMTEFGDPSTEDGYRWLHAMDPYVHVTASTAYPAVMFSVGLNDQRVAPWMSAKMAARLLAATSSGRPVLLRADDQAGHGVGSTRAQVSDTRADIYSFFLANTAGVSAGGAP